MEFNVQQKYFNLIKGGKKIFEGRLAKDKYRTMKVGDTIIFSPNDGSESLEKVIKSIHIYASFAEAGLHLGVENIVPGITDIDGMVNIYRNFYSKDDETKYNVIMIGI